MFPAPHELRHDALVARAARMLREVEANPRDWLEGPRERRAARLEGPEPGEPLARLARGLARLGALGLVVAAVVAVVEGMR